MKAYLAIETLAKVSSSSYQSLFLGLAQRAFSNLTFCHSEPYGMSAILSLSKDERPPFDRLRTALDRVRVILLPGKDF